jgi:type II secretory pathway pseudopilin PulG
VSHPVSKGGFEMIKNNNGIAIITAIVIFAVLSILGAAIMTVALSDTKQVVYQENQIKAHYAARAGADSVASYLIKNPSEAKKIVGVSNKNPITTELDGRTVKVFVSGTQDDIFIESTSFIDDKPLKTVYLNLRAYNLLDFGVFADQIIDTGNNVQIIGNIGTNSSSILFGNNLVDGNIVLGPTATTADLAAAENKLTSGHTASANTSLIELGPSNVSSPVPFVGDDPNASVNGNFVKTIDSNLNAIVKDINLSGNNEHLTLTSTNNNVKKIHLKVTGNITISGSSSIKTLNNTILFIYYDKSDTITFNGGPNSQVVIYAPNATINYNGGGNGTTYGNFICKVFDGPDASGTEIRQNTNVSMSDLQIDGIPGYVRGAWSD